MLVQTRRSLLLAAAALILGGVYIATRAPRHIVASAARTK